MFDDILTDFEKKPKRKKPDIKVKSTQYKSNLENNLNKLFERSKKLVEENYKLRDLIYKLFRLMHHSNIEKEVIDGFELNFNQIQED